MSFIQLFIVCSHGNKQEHKNHVHVQILSCTFHFYFHFHFHSVGTGPRDLRHMWRGKSGEEMLWMQISRLLWSGKSFISHLQFIQIFKWSVFISRCARNTTGFSIRNIVNDSRFEMPRDGDKPYHIISSYISYISWYLSILIICFFFRQNR